MDVIKGKGSKTVHAVVRAHKKATTRYCAQKAHHKGEKFRRDLLQSPEEFYSQQLKRYTRNRTQCLALCPFHDDHNPSFSANLETGAFFCFACAASGGNVLDFFIKKSGLQFKDACKALGVWHE